MARTAALNPLILNLVPDGDEHEFETDGRLGRSRYSTFEFVLHLSQAVHERLAAHPHLAIASSRDISFEDINAFSVYFHETIHWWQHVGSTYGLILSMTYPAETHINYRILVDLMRQVGFKKSVRQLAQKLGAGGHPDSPAGLANIAINNQFDYHAYRQLTLSPNARLEATKSPLFECVGHAFKVAYNGAVSMLSTVVDRDFEVLPHPQSWHESMVVLRENKELGYHYGSAVHIQPVGSLHVMEGQARMAQIQYLSFGSGHQLQWEHFRELGMLKGAYGAAFDLFLTQAGLDWPESVDHPVVALFLLICDMAINPGAGFPFTVRYPEAFIADVDPGARFVALSVAVRLFCPEVAQAIKLYSLEEYEEVSEKLAKALLIDSPLSVAREVASWPERSAGFAALMREWETFDFAPVNLPVRVMLSHFVAFMADKALRPQFFCWPGAWCAGERVSVEETKLFDKHAALFLDKLGNTGVFPRVIPGRDPALVQATFQTFFGVITVYDLTRQWITQPGPFSFKFGWLVEDADEQMMENFASANFKSAYGVDPADVEVDESTDSPGSAS